MLSTLDAAKRWVDDGYSVIPVCPKSKFPLQDWRQFQTRLPKVPELFQWFQKTNNNIGVVCGGQNNLVVLDFDSMPGYYNFLTKIQERNDAWNDVVNKTFRVKTRRGVHLYLRTAEAERSRGVKEDHIDIRGARSMVIVPPSVHPTGFHYRELNNNRIISVQSTTEIYPSLYPIGAESTVLDHPSGIFDVFDWGNGTIKYIKNSVPILDYVSRFRYMRRTSEDGRWWIGKCLDPLHRDLHPSMRLDAMRNRVKCLTTSCRLYHDIGLDIIDLHCILNNKSTKEAVADLLVMFL